MQIWRVGDSKMIYAHQIDYLHIYEKECGFKCTIKNLTKLMIKHSCKMLECVMKNGYILTIRNIK